MGWIRHHGIVVTSEQRDKLQAAHAKATEIFPAVSPIVDGVVNSSGSFFVPPDGSNEGWLESGNGDIQRDAFVEYLESSSMDWIEYELDRNGGEARIKRASVQLQRKYPNE